MIKYIVTWMIAYFVMDPCPDLGKKDEFGRYIPSNCVSLHMHKEYDKHSKEFSDRKEAFEFNTRDTTPWVSAYSSSAYVLSTQAYQSVRQRHLH